MAGWRLAVDAGKVLVRIVVYIEEVYIEERSDEMRVWFNGRMVPSQGTDGGSIPLTRSIECKTMPGSLPAGRQGFRHPAHGEASRE